MKFPAANSVFANADGRILRMRFTADELVALLHRHDALDDLRKHRAERFERPVRQLVTDRADDNAGDAAHDVRFVTPLADLLQDCGLLFFRDAGLKDYDHDKIRSLKAEAGTQAKI